MGALVAIFSKAWTISDKWIGLALPVFLVIVGIVVEVSLDGTHKDWTTYVRDAWVFACHLSRILALLGAIYLAWRAERGPRSTGDPPWQKAAPVRLSRDVAPQPARGDSPSPRYPANR